MSYIFFIIFSVNVFASVNLKLIPSTEVVKQGEMATAKVVISGYNGSLVINGATVADSIYFFKTSPLIRNSENQNMETEATIIFLKVPKSNMISGLINNQEVNILWENLVIQPVEAPESFIFGDFQIPKKWNLFLISILLIVLSIGTVLIVKKLKHRKQKLLEKAEKQKLKKELIEAISYAEVVSIWQKKHFFISCFPQLEDDFLKWEQTLFKFVFKPSISETEKDLVLSSYSEFKLKVGEKLSGV